MKIAVLAQPHKSFDSFIETTTRLSEDIGHTDWGLGMISIFFYDLDNLLHHRLLGGGGGGGVNASDILIAPYLYFAILSNMKHALLHFEWAEVLTQKMKSLESDVVELQTILKAQVLDSGQVRENTLVEYGILFLLVLLLEVGGTD